MFNARKCIYCGNSEIYEQVKSYAKNLNLAAGFTRGGHRGNTAKKLRGEN